MVRFKTRRQSLTAVFLSLMLASCGGTSPTLPSDGASPSQYPGSTVPDPTASFRDEPRIEPSIEPSGAEVPPKKPEVSPPAKERPPAQPISSPSTAEAEPPEVDPGTSGFACESPEIDGLAFLDAGWHDGTELKWGDIGCFGAYEIAAPNMAVICSSDSLNGGWMTYAITDPPKLEGNFAPDSDPDIQYELWMTNLLWFRNTENEEIFYQLPWTNAIVFAKQNLASGTFHWAYNNQWFNGDGQLVYDLFNPRYIDTRYITSAPAGSFAVTYLLYWPTSNFNGAGSASYTVPLQGVGFCGV